MIAPEFTFSRLSYARFIAMVTMTHVITYVAAGTLAYFFIYEASIDAGGFDQFMRNPNNPEEWRHVEAWVLPAQLLRGLLFGLALTPFLRTLASWTLTKRTLSILVLLLVFSVFGVTMPASGSIEGWVYLRPGSGPELPSPILGYVEVPTQLAVFSLLVAWRIGRLART